MKLSFDALGRVTGAEVTVPFDDPGFDADSDLVFDAMIGHLESLSKLPEFAPTGDPDGDLLDGDGNVIATGDSDALVDALIDDLRRRGAYPPKP